MESLTYFNSAKKTVPLRTDAVVAQPDLVGQRLSRGDPRAERRPA